MSVFDEQPGDDERLHYPFRISLRISQPEAEPDRFTQAFGIEPRHAWRAGAARQTPAGTPLPGVNKSTYWMAQLNSGKWPITLNDGLSAVLSRLAPMGPVIRDIREEGGRVELFVGWFLENQTGDVISHDILALAGQRQIDISLDVYPPTSPQS